MFLINLHNFFHMSISPNMLIQNVTDVYFLPKLIKLIMTNDQHVSEVH